MRSHRAIPSLASQASSRRSGPSASAIPGASRSTARPATSLSPTSARAHGRKSTLRLAGRARGRSTAGTPSRGRCGSHRSRCPGADMCRRCSCARIRRATARSRAATSSARPICLHSRGDTYTRTSASASCGRRCCSPGSAQGDARIGAECRQPVELRRGPRRLRLRRLAPGRGLPADREPRSRRAVRDVATAPDVSDSGSCPLAACDGAIPRRRQPRLTRRRPRRRSSAARRRARRTGA